MKYNSARLQEGYRQEFSGSPTPVESSGRKVISKQIRKPAPLAGAGNRSFPPDFEDVQLSPGTREIAR